MDYGNGKSVFFPISRKKSQNMNENDEIFGRLGYAVGSSPVWVHTGRAPYIVFAYK